MRRISHEVLDMMPYKVLLVRELEPTNAFFALLSRPDTNLQKMPILQKIIFFSNSKIFVFEAKKSRTHTLKIPIQPNESLFVADFGSET